jgi:hypothetical protein
MDGLFLSSAELPLLSTHFMISMGNVSYFTLSPPGPRVVNFFEVGTIHAGKLLSKTVQGDIIRCTRTKNNKERNGDR